MMMRMVVMMGVRCGNGSDAGGGCDGGADGRKMVGVGVMAHIHDICISPPNLLPNLLILLYPLEG